MIDKQKEKLNMKVAMDQVRHCPLPLSHLPALAEELAGTDRHTVHLRRNYITKKIRWQWWKDAERPVRFIMSWVDALVFALVAVYFINQFAFQNYVIPSSSLEKSCSRATTSSCRR
jgi:signal peptidase I